MAHFAMLQTTKYCSRIQVKTHSTMLAINFLCKQTTRMGDLQRHVIAPGVKTLVCSDSTSDNTSVPYQSIVSIGGQ